MTSQQIPTARHGFRVRLAAVLLGGALGAVTAWALWPRGEPTSSEPTSRAQAQAFLRAVERSQTSTYTAEGTFTRRAEDGRTLVDPEILVRRPPDRMTYGLGSWGGVVNGRGVQCQREGRYGPFVGCTSSPGRSTIDDDELPRLRQLLGGSSPLYRASETGTGCFQLRLVVDVEAIPEYGKRAVLCFDEATGAPKSRRIEHETGTDVTTYDRISAAVDPRDLDLP